MLTISFAPAARLLGGGRARAPRCPRRPSPRCGARRPRSPRPPSRPEVALLVEHAVVGQMHLAVDRAHARRRARPRRCRRRSRALGEADDRDQPLAPAAPARRAPRARPRGSAPQQQILGRIAGERELGEQHELARPRRARRASPRGCAGRCRRCRRPSRSSGRAPGALSLGGRAAASGGPARAALAPESSAGTDAAPSAHGRPGRAARFAGVRLAPRTGAAFGGFRGGREPADRALQLQRDQSRSGSAS